MDNRKPIFSVIGTVDFDGHTKRMRLNSPQYWQAMIQKLTADKRYGITVEEYKASRSQAQLKYYFVLLGYLADYSGHSAEELHDVIMRTKFGTKKVKLVNPKTGKTLLEEEVRRSVSNMARFPKSDMVDLIMEVLNLCVELDIKIPTKEELGYL